MDQVPRPPRQSVKARIATRIGTGLGIFAGGMLHPVLTYPPIAEALRQRGLGWLWVCGHSSSFVVVVGTCSVFFVPAAIGVALLGYYLGRRVDRWRSRRAPPASS